jgi:hypothetical protein
MVLRAARRSDDHSVLIVTRDDASVAVIAVLP